MKRAKNINYNQDIKMKNLKIVLFSVMILSVLALSSFAFAGNYSETIAVFKQSGSTKPFFKNSYGYAVFPTVGKGGFVVGGAYGNGQVYKKSKLTGKSKVTGTVELAKISIGLQLGGQAFSEIIFFQDKRAYNDFTSGSFEFDASAVVITAGAQAKVGTEGATASASAGPATGDYARINYLKGMAVFVHTKGGLMYEATIGGQKFTFSPK